MPGFFDRNPWAAGWSAAGSPSTTHARAAVHEDDAAIADPLMQPAKVAAQSFGQTRPSQLPDARRGCFNSRTCPDDLHKRMRNEEIARRNFPNFWQCLISASAARKLVKWFDNQT